MKSFLTGTRASGILAHITSLPSPFGIGDIGPSSYLFLEFLQKSGQTYWQILPSSPTNSVFDNSPYMSCSAFAGSPLLISCELLVKEGLLARDRFSSYPDFSDYQVEFKQVIAFKKEVLEEAFSNFTPSQNNHYCKFIEQNNWLDDYALFMTIKEQYPESGWFDWPEKLISRDSATIDSLRQQFKSRIDYYLFEQFEFFRQWQLLRDEAEKRGIKLIGDIPIYVSSDSVDVWANQDIFQLDLETHQPTHVAGVPPDYFSDTGQRWGNPLYQWQTEDSEIKQKLLSWWTQRFRATFQMVDVVRVDHFRGFADYWSIRAEEETAIKGDWHPGPGESFFKEIIKRLGPLNIIAEDLGIITEDVKVLRDALAFPGMKILQFAFDDDPNNSYLPHNFTTTNCIVYTGTHDNNTSLGWFLSDQMSEELRARVMEYANRSLQDQAPIHQSMIYLALQSIAALAIIPLQDVLGYGGDCKMNTPSTSTGNWRWRCHPHALTDEISDWLLKMTKLFGRDKK